ncbi:MAG: hypothetical protein RIQ81_587 [Pseudomonadota bacterium]
MEQSLLMRSRTARILTTGWAIWSVAACVTTPDPKPQKSTTKNVQVAPPAPPKETHRPPNKQGPLVLAPVPDSAIADFASRHAISVAQLSDADEALLKRMPNQPQAGSMHEAALVLGIVKGFNPANIDGVPAKAAGDVDAPAVAQVPDAGGLEKAALARGVDLPGALEVNPFLQSATVTRLVFLAADRGGNSEAFTKRLRAALNRQLNEWSSLAERYNAGQANNLAATAAPAAVTPTASTPEAQAPQMPEGSVSDLHSSDVIINDAAKQADEGQFDKAITTLKKVKADSPLSKLAKDRSMEYANMAVRDLRRRAAQAFSAAVQANDPGTKGNYLEKAKTLLEEALAKYQDADQLGTVRDNLTVINRDLERLKTSRKQ